MFQSTGVNVADGAKNKVESLQGYDSIEANDNVIKLLNGLKELTFKTHKVQYGYWTICQTVRRVLAMRQHRTTQSH
jgi:hypothetical protein